MLVGRHQDAEILLQSTDISRKHAALLFRDDHIWVKDLKSTNGTFVNGERVEQEQEIELHDGDMLQFASFMFMILALSVIRLIYLKLKFSRSNDSTHDQGMQALPERAAETGITRDGMPQQVSIQKPTNAENVPGWGGLLTKSLCLWRNQSAPRKEQKNAEPVSIGYFSDFGGDLPSCSLNNQSKLLQ